MLLLCTFKLKFNNQLRHFQLSLLNFVIVQVLLFTFILSLNIGKENTVIVFNFLNRVSRENVHFKDPTIDQCALKSKELKNFQFTEYNCIKH